MQKATIASLHNQLINYQNSNTLTVAQKSNVAGVINNYLVIDPQQFNKEKSTVLPLIEDLVIASVTIAVLTRPRVKEVFND
jgi:hypothetical protein